MKVCDIYEEQGRYFAKEVDKKGRSSRREVFESICERCKEVRYLRVKNQYCLKCRTFIKKEARKLAITYDHYKTDTGESTVTLFTKSRKKYTVSQCDVDSILRLSWTTDKDGYLVTVIRVDDNNKRYIKMHRFIMGAKDGELVDHKNNDPSDNTRGNLRFCTRSQNAINSKAHEKVCGVYFCKIIKKFTANIRVNSRTLRIGSFSKREDAITARLAAEKKYFGEFRYELN